jgi:hypothetical protein
LPTNNADEIKLIVSSVSAVVNPSATNTSMYILTLLSKHPLSPCFGHHQLASIKHHSVTMGNHPTFVSTLQGFNAEAFLVQIEVYEHSHFGNPK